ncbi:SRPBCC domain-containing protein [Gordonia sp. NPDC062954]|uniref:SRPBCC domain-containing protein n=1 Tax=Gordonia sp. NPDC062954 TaxID=3364003 RepID=UPI0037CB6F1B
MNQKATDRFGTVVRDGDKLSLRYERHLAHSPEKVWSALTESDSLRHWFPADIVGVRAAGALVQLPFWPDEAAESQAALEDAGVDTTRFDFDEVLPGEIREFDPPKVFELVWGNPQGKADVLRFELEPTADGTRLVFTTWPGEPGPMGHAGTAAGWHACLDALQSLVETGAVHEDRQDVIGLRGHYASLLAESS